MTIARKCSCIICRKLISNLGLPGHVKIVHEKFTDFQELGLKARLSKPSWNKGLTKETSKSVLQSSKTISKSMSGKSRNIVFTDKGRKTLSDLSYTKKEFSWLSRKKW